MVRSTKKYLRNNRHSLKYNSIVSENYLHSNFENEFFPIMASVIKERDDTSL